MPGAMAPALSGGSVASAKPEKVVHRPCPAYAAKSVVGQRFCMEDRCVGAMVARVQLQCSMTVLVRAWAWVFGRLHTAAADPQPHPHLNPGSSLQLASGAGPHDSSTLVDGTRPA